MKKRKKYETAYVKQFWPAQTRSQLPWISLWLSNAASSCLCLSSISSKWHHWPAGDCYTLHGLCSLHITVYSIPSVLVHVQFTVYSVQCTLYKVHTVFKAQCIHSRPPRPCSPSLPSAPGLQDWTSLSKPSTYKQHLNVTFSHWRLYTLFMYRCIEVISVKIKCFMTFPLNHNAF